MKRLLLIVIILGVIPSCFCPDSDFDYVKINSIDLNTEIDNNKTQKITIWINFLDYDYIVNNHINYSFVKTAIATSCRNEGGSGLKPRIDSIILVSNSTFNGILPGNSINQYTKSYFKGQDIELDIETDWLHEYLNNHSYLYSFLANISIVEEPNDSLNHIFTVKLMMSDGTVIKESTNEIEYK